MMYNFVFLVLLITASDAARVKRRTITAGSGFMCPDECQECCGASLTMGMGTSGKRFKCILKQPLDRVQAKQYDNAKAITVTLTRELKYAVVNPYDHTTVSYGFNIGTTTGGHKVVSVTKGSPADGVLEVTDKIEAVNGEDASNILHKDISDRIGASNSVEITVLRSDRTLWPVTNRTCGKPESQNYKVFIEAEMKPPDSRQAKVECNFTPVERKAKVWKELSECSHIPDPNPRRRRSRRRQEYPHRGRHRR